MVFHTVSAFTRSYWCRSQLPMPRMSLHGTPGQSVSTSSPQPDGSFADDQHFSLDSGLRFGVLSVGRKICATNEFFNKLDAVEDIAAM